MSNNIGEKAPDKQDRFIRLPEVKHLTGLPRASIYQQMAQGTFPRAVPLTTRTVGWLESEILAWKAERIRARIGMDER